MAYRGSATVRQPLPMVASAAAIFRRAALTAATLLLGVRRGAARLFLWPEARPILGLRLRPRLGLLHVAIAPRLEVSLRVESGALRAEPWALQIESRTLRAEP